MGQTGAPRTLQQYPAKAVTFSGPRPNIDDERNLAQSPIEEKPCYEQTVAEISIGTRCLP